VSVLVTGEKEVRSELPVEVDVCPDTVEITVNVSVVTGEME
jgi:hypothetical protein